MLCQVPDDTCRWKLNYKSCKTSEVWSAITLRLCRRRRPGAKNKLIQKFRPQVQARDGNSFGR
jgi:hypothetical protein